VVVRQEKHFCCGLWSEEFSMNNWIEARITIFYYCSSSQTSTKMKQTTDTTRRTYYGMSDHEIFHVRNSKGFRLLKYKKDVVIIN